MLPIQDILIIGAGELGDQVLKGLALHPMRSGTSIAVLLRPSSVSSPSKEKAAALEVWQTLGVRAIPGDITTASQTELASVFAHYDTIIGCTGFVAGPGVQTKLARAVLEAKVPRYIPWQFGVDYDLIGRGSAQDLFDEQLVVRDILREQSATKWAIISTGMFTSFLFEPSFGVVDLQNSSIHALGSLENRVTVTAAEDIGKLTAEAVLGVRNGETFSDSVTFIGGDTVSYDEVAGLLEDITGKPFTRHVITVEEAQEGLSKDAGDALLKYQVVFGQGRGVAWDMSKTWNRQIGFHALTAEEWAVRNLTK